MKNRLAKAKIRARSGIRLIRTEERGERLAGNMKNDDTRRGTVAQSNPRPPKVSPLALGVLELGDWVSTQGNTAVQMRPLLASFRLSESGSINACSLLNEVMAEETSTCTDNC